jgi:phage gp36-like protein
MNYCSIDDLITRFGLTNLTTWAAIDGNNSDPLITTRQQLACDMATAQINTMLSRGGYAIPLQFMDTYSQSFINDIAIDLAVYLLYKARGHADEDKDFSKFEECRRKAMNELMRIRAGSNQINLARRWGDNPTVPTIL